jgi:hypothetical protein
MSSTHGTAGEERRAFPRYKARFPISIDAGERKERVGLSHDASAQGLLFNTPSRFAREEELELTCYLPSTLAEAVRLRAHVVRVETAPAGLPWKYLAAVRFDEPAPQLDAPLRALESGWPV